MKYYKLIPNCNDLSLRALEMLEPEFLDVNLFKQGGNIESQVGDWRLRFDTRGAFPDLVAHSLLFCSPRLASTFKAHAGADVQIISIPSYTGTTRADVEYDLVHPLRLTSCLNLSAADVAYRDGRIRAIFKHVLDPSKIPAGLNLFRLAEQPHDIFVSDKLVKIWRGEKFSGIHLLPVPLQPT